METYRIHDSRGSTAGACNKAPPSMPLLDLRLARFNEQVLQLAELTKRADAALDRVIGGLPRAGIEGEDGNKMPADALSKFDIALALNQDMLQALAFQVNRLESL
jgi:hypothetical protein